MTLGDKLDELIAKGPALRKAGYLCVEVDGIKVQLAPADPELPIDWIKELETESVSERDPLRDPSSFGLPEGAPVPGFSRLLERALDER